MSQPWTLGRVLALIAMIVSLVLLVLAFALPAVTHGLIVWTLILVALVALAEVLS